MLAAKLQKFSDGAMRCDIYTVHLSHLPLRMAFYLFVGMESRYPMLARIVRESNSALLAEQVDNVSAEIIISPRITREKIYPAVVFAHVVLHGASFP